MANIPPEIWCHIAKFILKEDLRDLFGVNKVFFNIAMNIRYREIDISTRTTDQDIMIKTLKTKKKETNKVYVFMSMRNGA